MVAGGFNGAAWRKKSGDDQQRDSTIEEAFANTKVVHHLFLLPTAKDMVGRVLLLGLTRDMGPICGHVMGPKGGML